MPGEIYAYNLANGKLNLESNVKNSTVKAFVKYNGQLYCHGSYKIIRMLCLRLIIKAKVA